MADKNYGWTGIETAEKAFTACEKDFIQFRIYGQSPSSPPVPLWRLAKRINNGKHIPTIYQLTGDCVATGASHVLDYLTVAEVVARGKAFEIKEVFPPYLYGMSRTAPDLGNGQLGRSGGSTGAWMADAAKKYGVLFSDDKDVPKYTKEVAEEWGYKGPDKKFQELASDNLVKSVARITTIDEIRDALINYYPVTIASSWAFKVSKKSGIKTYVRNPYDTWYHQMCFIAWRDDPFPSAFRLNSWGDSTGEALEDEPIGGAWQSAEEIKQELRTGVEVYAYSSFDGFPAAGNSRVRFV